MLNEEQNYEEELIDMKSIPIDKRPNIGVQDMNKYKNGGLTVESLEANGALVYIPYGIYCELFRAMENSMLLLQKNIEETMQSSTELISDIIKEEIINNNKHYDEAKNVQLVKQIEDKSENVIQECNKSIEIFQNIYPMIDEV